MSQCIQCGGENPASKGSRPLKYCSRKCYLIFNRKPKEPCQVCGGKVPFGYLKNCSEKCRSISRKKTQRAFWISKRIQKTMHQKKCRFCDGDFETTDKRKKYCSEKCSSKFHGHKKSSSYELVGDRLQRIVSHCAICNEEIDYTNPNKVVCCDKCFQVREKKRRRTSKGKSPELTYMKSKCQTCDNEFTKTENGRDSHAVYCSNKCREAGFYEQMKARKRKDVQNIGDAYVIQTIQQKHTRKGFEAPPASTIPQFLIDATRIQLLVSRGKRLDEDLSNQKKVKQFEETLTRTLRGNTAILPK